MVGVDLDALLPLLGQLVLREARVHGARLDTRVGVNAFLRIDAQLRLIVELLLVLGGWMQSTGQISTHERSFVPMHGSAITYTTG